jgi:hypothetical protein
MSKIINYQKLPIVHYSVVSIDNWVKAGLLNLVLIKCKIPLIFSMIFYRV